jgi:hypothetical protein
MYHLTSKYKLTAAVAILIAILSVSGSPESAIKKSTIRWAVQRSSSLHIAGKTNVAGFGCTFQGYDQMDTITYQENDDPNQVVPLKGSLQIDINKFDCHNKYLTSDFRKILKANEHPKLLIRFIAFERIPSFERGKDVLRGWVDIDLAGVCRRFEILYGLEKSGALVQLNSTRSFCFSDFNLTPPKKLGGMIKVKDDFQIQFKLMMTRVG